MSDSIITVENLSKSYLLGHRAIQGKRYVALRDVVERGARNFARNAADLVRGRQILQGDEVEEFWALRDVSFEVKEGEVLGIIGRNGAGKSTLLKILSRITEPTEGRAVLRGRVASLLEVGTGFHPELTGRENIFLNGAILGMSQREIRKKLDEIVTFAEVERFLDTPVKRYSSGMYVRLAFAIAAHLEPEILIVDEVLAVGDAKFQEQSLRKMRDQAAGGRTVLFVSHNMSAILQLTKRAIVLSQGRVEFSGSPNSAVERYLCGQRAGRSVQFNVENTERRCPGTGDARIMSLRFDRSLALFKFGESISYVIRVRAERPVNNLRASMTVFTRDGSAAGNSFSQEIEGLEGGEEQDLTVTLSSINLAPGSYYCAVAIGKGTHRTSRVEYDLVTDTLFFEVMSEETEAGAMAEWPRHWGPICFKDLSVSWA
ncbi:MAG: ABC transporter ATP-binding protein [Candidatus Acidiferrales bacterium]